MRTLKAIAGAAILGACTRHPPLVFETTPVLDAGAAHPPGVAVDRIPELPKAAASADADKEIAVLETPHDLGVARGVVHAFFDAVLAESPERIDEVLDESAWILTGSSGRHRARAFWHARLKALNYRGLSGQALYREGDLHTYRAEDVDRLTGRRSLALVPSGDEVLFEVPIMTPIVGTTRLFADEVWLLLRPKGTGFVIAEISEDFRLP